MTVPVAADLPASRSFDIDGPFEALLRRLGAAGPGSAGAVRRALACVALAWLPLLLLSIHDGRAWGGTALPFLGDAYVGARFLAVIPLSFAAESLLLQRLPVALSRFASRGMVRPEEQARFDAIVASTLRWAGSWRLELVLLLLVVGLGIAGAAESASAIASDTWFRPASSAAPAPLARWWLLCVSAPLFQFLMLRWYLRLLLWWTLMARLSRLGLQLEPLHPDKAGGLGFLAQLSLAFAPLAMAQGAMAAGWIANQLFYAGARLPQFKLEIVASVALVVLAIVGPLLAFVPRLLATKRKGLGRYGNLATRYAREFEGRWLRGAAPAAESPVGSGDIQSLADLGNSYSTLQLMRPLPFGPQTLTTLAVAMLAPMAPLLLTVMSVDELVQGLGQLLF